MPPEICLLCLESGLTISRSAQLLLASQEIEGACNRACYAMYDAAHAALLAEDKIDYKITETHSGLIAAFGLHVIATGKLSRQLGRSLNEVQEIRMLTDYQP